MDSNLTVAETSPEGYQSVGNFSVSPCGQWAAFTTKRGRMVGASGERGHGDGGTDLLCLDLTAPGAHPFALATGASGVSKAVWTAKADGSSAAVARLDRAIVLFERLSATDPEGVLVHTLLEIGRVANLSWAGQVPPGIPGTAGLWGWCKASSPRGVFAILLN